MTLEYTLENLQDQVNDLQTKVENQDLIIKKLMSKCNVTMEDIDDIEEDNYYVSMNMDGNKVIECKSLELKVDILPNKCKYPLQQLLFNEGFLFIEKDSTVYTFIHEFLRSNKVDYNEIHIGSNNNKVDHKEVKIYLV